MATVDTVDGPKVVPTKRDGHVVGKVADPDPEKPNNARVVSSPRRRQDSSGAIGKNLYNFNDVTWKEFLTLISNGASKVELLHKMGITNASFNIWLASTPGAAAEYENARMQWTRREWPMELVEELMVDIILGVRVDEMCRMRGISESAFYMVMMRDPVYKDMYDEARRMNMERKADELMKVAEEIELDAINTTANSAKVNKARLRSDNMKWLMERLHPKRFGSRTHQSVDLKTTVNHAEELDKARKRQVNIDKERHRLLKQAGTTTVH